MAAMITRISYDDAPKQVIKHAANKARRREDRDTIQGNDDNQTPLPETYFPCYQHFPEHKEYIKVPFALLIWDDGLDYNMDGTSYQDDCPGDHPHSYHLTRESAEMEQDWLEHTNPGRDPRDFTIVADFWVPFWDAHRIPLEPYPFED